MKYRPKVGDKLYDRAYPLQYGIVDSVNGDGFDVRFYLKENNSERSPLFYSYVGPGYTDAVTFDIVVKKRQQFASQLRDILEDSNEV